MRARERASVILGLSASVSINVRVRGRLHLHLHYDAGGGAVTAKRRAAAFEVSSWLQQVGRRISNGMVRLDDVVNLCADVFGKHRHEVPLLRSRVKAAASQCSPESGAFLPTHNLAQVLAICNNNMLKLTYNEERIRSS